VAPGNRVCAFVCLAVSVRTEGRGERGEIVCFICKVADLAVPIWLLECW
jgi:hypothetical protein